MYNPLQRFIERLRDDKEHGNTFTDNEREAFNAGCEALHGVDVATKYTILGLGGYRDTLNSIIWTHPEKYKCNGGDISVEVRYFDKRVNSEERWVIMSMVEKIDRELSKYEI